MAATTTAEQLEAAASLAQSVRNRAWRFDRWIRENFEHPREGTVGRILAATDIAKEAYELGPGLTPKAHKMLARGICADIRADGETFLEAVRLLSDLYCFLSQGLGMRYESGEWVAPPEKAEPESPPPKGG